MEISFAGLVTKERAATENGSAPVTTSAVDLCLDWIREMGEDPSRPGLLQTPLRFSKAMAELTSGYNQSIEQIVNGAVFEEDYSELVLVRDIEFFSLCEHHLLPFFGKVHVAYIPDGRIIGLSKIPRMVKMFSRRLQIQERLTTQIAEALNDLLAPRGVACAIEGCHLCVMMRGIQSTAATMVTTSMTGCFLEQSSAREEFLNLVRQKT